MNIALGCDHAGYEVKEKVKEYIAAKYNYEVIDFGANSLDSVDYPIYGHKVGNYISENLSAKGIVICGSGIGISIAANKINGVRAALCTSVKHAEMSRKHNDSNVLALGARMTEYDTILMIIDAWFSTNFEGGRHFDRIQKIEKK